MKLTIQKTYTATIDTSIERARINKAFKDSPTIKKKLLQLISLVEQQKWNQAHKLLESKWFRARDKKLGCPRLEFVGMLFRWNGNEGSLPYGFDSWATYAGLVDAFIYKKENYKVLAVDNS